MAQNSKYAIETVSLTKTFNDWWGRTKVLAVDDLNLKVNYNEVYGLLGPNGSGKTTTIKMLLSLLHPTKGASFILGGRSSDPKISARIGFLPEESYLYKYLTARESLEFYAKLFGLPAKVRKTRIDSLLEMVGLTGMSNRQVGTFSKGMARRIGLAGALINDPELLILDEPTSGLDPIGTRQIKDLIIELSKRGKTILLCSHLLGDVEDVCDRISILYGGKMRTEGRVNDLLSNTGRHEISSNILKDSTIKKIKELIKQDGQDPMVTYPRIKLEKYFIDIVNQAQNEQQSTSGAVSTQKIGDFLKNAEMQKGILDQLVHKETPGTESIPSQKVTTDNIESTQPEANKDLLNKLSKSNVTSKPTTTIDVEKPTAPEAPTQNIDNDLLKSLTKPDTNKQNPNQESSE